MSRRCILCLALLAACGDNVDQAPLTTIVQAGPSATCPTGGSVIESGADTNGDGMLGSNEITTTQEICNGTTGGAGTAGSSGGSLITVDNQVGSNCPLGGSRIQTGLDTNGDGVLEASEVTSTQYVCSELAGSAYYFGDLTIGSAADLAIAQQYGAVIGNVFVLPSFGGDLSWPDLVFVMGTFDVEPTLSGSALSIELPAATSIQQLEIDGRSSLTSVTADALTSADVIDIESDPELTTVSFAALSRMGGPSYGGETYFAVSSDPMLTSLTASRLSEVDEVDVNNTALTALDLSGLSSVQNYLGIGGNPALASLDLSGLSYGGYVTINFDGITDLALPSLSAVNYFAVYDNPTLATVELPSLTTVYNYLDIYNNPDLPTCSLFALRSAIIARTNAWASNFEFYGNDDGGTCVGDPCIPETFADISGATFELCYATALDWSDAETYCETTFSGGALATFGSDAEWSDFRADALAISWFGDLGTVWLGYTDAAVDGTWVPPGGVTAGYLPATDDSTFWSTGDGEPNGGTNENCAQFPEDNYVNDLSCSSALSFVCRH